MSFGVGESLAVAGLLMAFDGAVKSYLLIEAFFDKDNGSRDLALTYHVQRHRLKLWGDHFMVQDPAKCLLVNESERTKALILQILARIKTLHENAKPFVDRYEMDVSNQSYSNLITPLNEAQQSQPESALVSRVSKLQMDKKQKGRFRWVIKDRDKFAAIVLQLERYNSDLFAVLGPRDADKLLKSLSAYVLAAVTEIESLKALQGTNTSSTALLALSSKLKELQISASSTPAMAKRVSQPSCWKALERGDRAVGIHSGPGMLPARVWVEWKYLDASLIQPERQELEKRIEALGAMLSAVNLHDLRIPACLGIFEDADYEPDPESLGETRTGFLYEIPGGPEYDPSTKPITLSDIIAKNKEPPLLGERFKLAYTLATSLSLLHASNWLHKAFRSDNILFFHHKKRPKPSFPSILDPYITGFEYARPYDGPSLDKRPTGNPALDYYYHPEVNHGFTKIFDLYSLGVVLFEIAWWRPLHEKINPTKKVMPQEKFREILLDNVGKLGSSMGEIYRDVVRKCLECDFPQDEEELAHDVFAQVVRELESCRA